MRRLVLMSALLLSLSCWGQIDSLSYAMGYRLKDEIRSTRMNYLGSDDDVDDFFKGIEDKRLCLNELQDSSARYSYIAAVNGFLELYYVNQGNEHTVPILSGFKKVAENSLSLPQDTVMARRVLESNDNPSLLPEGESDKFYESFGVMSCYPPELNQVLEQMTGRNLKADYQSYARGLADMASLTVTPADNYNLGQNLGVVMVFSSLGIGGCFFSDDYISGINASLGRDRQKMTEEEVDAIMLRYYKSLYGDDYEEGDDFDEDYWARPDSVDVEQLECCIDIGRKYEVDWVFTAYCPTSIDIMTTDIGKMMKSVVDEIDRKGIGARLLNDYGQQMIFETIDCNSTDFAEIQNVIAIANAELFNKFGSRYKIFCYRENDDKMLLGLIDVDNRFDGHVYEASLEELYGVKRIDFKFGNDETKKSEAEQWREFTARNFNKTIVCEINGSIVMTPRIMSEIISGACSVGGLSNERINDLFLQCWNCRTDVFVLDFGLK